MATLPSLPLQSSNAVRAFIVRLSKSRFFTISIALHFLFVLLFGSVVLVRQVAPRTDFDDTTGGLIAPAAPPAQEPIQPMDSQTQAPTNPTNASVAPSLSVLTTLASSQSAFQLPAAPVTPTVTRTFAPDSSSAPAAPKAPSFSGIPAPQAQKMAQFTGGWASPGTGSGVNKERAFKFTAYLAKYGGGDWDSTVHLTEGRITKGSLPNLLFLLKKWSRNKIDATPDAIPLDLASDEVFAKKPPFIFFTGHQDFVLSDAEVKNLQQYLQVGGAIWGDSSLPGKHSRFDIAFRREMKRVLPDKNIQWEALPPDHPIYTQTYYPEIRVTPPGLNYCQEPVYVLKNFGEVSIFYTANDYGDMWQIGLTEKGEYDLTRTDRGDFIVTNWPMFLNRDIYFRNLSPKSLVDSYKFGTNIILHLLTRWEDKLRNVPTGL